jgi:hypothetical protein
MASGTIPVASSPIRPTAGYYGAPTPTRAPEQALRLTGLDSTAVVAHGDLV